LRHIKGFQDETSGGRWKGHRSSRLNLQYRVFYRLESERVVIEEVSVTPHASRRTSTNGRVPKGPKED